MVKIDDALTQLSAAVDAERAAELLERQKHAQEVQDAIAAAKKAQQEQDQVAFDAAAQKILDLANQIAGSSFTPSGNVPVGG